MKIKVSKITIEETDIELPAYHKNGNGYLKTIEQAHYIRVSLFEFDTTISECHYGTLLAGNNGENWLPCTEQEFNEAYDKALRILLTNRPLKRLAKLEKVFDVDEVPTNNRYENIPAL